MACFSGILLFFLFCLLSGTAASSDSEISVYYVRFDIKSANNRIERSNLLMVPAENEFRMENFTSFVISGGADYTASGKPGMAIQTRAEHNAIKNFLEIHGLESVKSQSTTVNGLAHSETVVSFEGAIRLPHRTVSSSFDADSGLYTVTIEISFAPLAFPDKWPEMQLKYKIRTLFRKMMSIF